MYDGVFSIFVLNLCSYSPLLPTRSKFYRCLWHRGIKIHSLFHVIPKFSFAGIARGPSVRHHYGSEANCQFNVKSLSIQIFSQIYVSMRVTLKIIMRCKDKVIQTFNWQNGNEKCWMEGHICCHIVGFAVGLRGAMFRVLCFLIKLKARRYFVVPVCSLRVEWAKAR